jgi:hypothetical protein
MEQTKRRENTKGSLEMGQEEQEDDSLEGVEHSPTQSEEEKGQSDAKDDSEKNHRLKAKMEEDKRRLMEETEKDKEKERARMKEEVKQEYIREILEMKDEEERKRMVFGAISPFGDPGVTRRSKERRADHLMEKFHRATIEEEVRRESIRGDRDVTFEEKTRRETQPQRQWMARYGQGFTTPKRVNWEGGMMDHPTYSSEDESEERFSREGKSHMTPSYSGESERTPVVQSYSRVKSQTRIIPYVRIQNLAAFYMDRRPLEV